MSAGLLEQTGTCPECGGGGRTAPGVVCPICRGNGRASLAQAERYWQTIRDGALDGARHAAAALGRTAVQDAARVVAAAQLAAQGHAETAALAATRAETALARGQRMLAADTAARAQLADKVTAQLAAIPGPEQFGVILPPIPPGHAPTVPGQQVQDPLLQIDSILVRELDVWGALNVAGSGGLMTNPMTTLGDLITGGAAGAPSRLGVGTANQVLTVVGGVPAWANSAAGFSNPMTTTQDLIVGGAAGAAGRLGVGAVGTLLSVSPGGLVVWGAGPMTTQGDLITASLSGLPARVPIGTAGQVLTVVAGSPQWQSAGSGGGLPLTTTGDMLISNPGATAVRLPVGSIYQHLAIAGGIPAWTTPPVIAIMPSGDVTGATDAANINNAFTALNGAGLGGTVQLGPGIFYTNATITVPQQTGVSTAGNACSLIGSRGGTYIFPTAAVSVGIFMHRNHMWGGSGNPQNAQPNPIAQSGTLAGFTLDGSNTAAGSVGIDVGDGWGGLLDVFVENWYSAAGTSIGVHIINRVSWTEKWTFRLHTVNCDQHVVCDTTNSSNGSLEYNVFDCFMYMLGGGNTASGAGQLGMQWLNGAFLGGGKLDLRGNHGGGGGGNSGTVLVVGGGGLDGVGGNWSQIYNTAIDLSVEGNGSTNLPKLIRLNASTNSIAGHGLIVAQFGGWSLSNLNGGNFKVSGQIQGDSNLATGWPSVTFPGLGSQWTNNGPDANVCIAGGTITGILVNSQPTGFSTAGGFTAGAFFIRAGDSIQVNGSVNPTVFNIVPAN